MLFACAGQACCMAILAGTIYDGSSASGIVATVMLFMFNFFFAVGLLAIPWLLPAEYAPLAIRTKAASLSSASNWLFTFLVVEITPVSIKSIGYKTYSELSRLMCIEIVLMTLQSTSRSSTCVSCHWCTSSILRRRTYRLSKSIAFSQDLKSYCTSDMLLAESTMSVQRAVKATPCMVRT